MTRSRLIKRMFSLPSFLHCTELTYQKRSYQESFKMSFSIELEFRGALNVCSIVSGSKIG